MKKIILTILILLLSYTYTHAECTGLAKISPTISWVFIDIDCDGNWEYINECIVEGGKQYFSKKYWQCPPNLVGAHLQKLE